ncbi:hypothetical protein FRC08_018751 [Ceratobasidium sp. 394]|nr:hypothetical protein FRC08_018751 [Ceratobasidium sp. 394]
MVGLPLFHSNLHRQDLLVKLLILFTVSSAISLSGVLASHRAYNDPFTTFIARLGIRTFLYHLGVLYVRLREDPHIFEHFCNIGILTVLCIIWVGGGIWSFYYGADLWGYKACRGCPGWELLRERGDWLVALESVVLVTCLVLCVQHRIRKPVAEQSESSSPVKEIHGDVSLHSLA